MITVFYESIDSYGEGKEVKFESLEAARHYAQEWVGRYPTISRSFNYAISDDGIGKITCAGCTIQELFPGAD